MRALFWESQQLNQPHPWRLQWRRARGYCWLMPPSLNQTEEGCAGTCSSWIRFSDATIPTLEVKNTTGGQPVNHGDLNSDGRDEIGMLCEWFSGCWRNYVVWTLQAGAWRYALAPIRTHCQQWEADMLPIAPHPSRPGYVIIRYSEHTGDAIITITKNVKLN